MSERIQWPIHTREEMECLRAEWDRPDGVIEIMPPKPSTAAACGVGFACGAAVASTAFFLIWLYGGI